MSSAAADVRAALATIAQSEKQLDAAQAQVLSAEADNTKAQLDLQRYTPLVERDVVSRQQYDAVVATAASKKAQRSAAQADLQGARAQVQVANDRLASARASYNSAGTGPKQVAAERAKADAAAAQVQQAEAALETDRLNLSYTKIVAPDSGIVNQKTAQVGQNVSAGQTLMTLIPLTNLWITANFKETQLDEMRIGQPATFKVDAYGGRTYHAKVTQIGGSNRLHAGACFLRKMQPETMSRWCSAFRFAWTLSIPTRIATTCFSARHVGGTHGAGEELGSGGDLSSGVTEKSDEAGRRTLPPARHRSARFDG